MSAEIDARGLACPQPVIAVKKALDAVADGVVTVLVDNAAARENVAKFAASRGCLVAVRDRGGHYLLTLTKGDPGPDAHTPAPAVSPASGVAYLITGDTIGRGSDELGAVLMNAFFYTLGEIEPPPRAILLLNSGVKLAVDGSPLLPHLAALAECGVRVLSCGTCLDHFGLRDRLAVGGVTNMYAILAELGAGRSVTL